MQQRFEAVATICTRWTSKAFYVIMFALLIATFVGLGGLWIGIGALVFLSILILKTLLR